MFGSENVKTAALVIEADPGGTDEIFYLMKAPRHLTILAAYVVQEQTQNAGTATTIQAENWGTAGTAVEGTIWAAVGGTASGARLTARTPAAATITATQDELDEGDWLIIRYGELGTGWIAGDRIHVEVHYVDGQGA